MRSLFDFFRKKNEELDCPVFNPLGLDFNNIVEITTPIFLGKSWRVCCIEEYKRVFEEQSFHFTDYVLINTKDKLDQIRLRSYEDRDLCIILTLFDSRGYNPDLHDVLTDTGKTDNKRPEDVGVFNIVDSNDIEIRFFRINDIKDPWIADVMSIEDKDGDRKFTKNDPIKIKTIDYWDFWRTLHIAGVEQTEYLFCEMDSESGGFTFWRGMDTDPQLISIM